MRKKLVAGNWKMNKTLDESVQLAREIKNSALELKGADILICPAYPALHAVHEVVKDSPVALGAQDMHWEDQGAFTGKVSGDMLKAVGVSHVILGHSEQRTLFGETNDNVNRKTKKALSLGLVPVICVGEKLEEREAGDTQKVVHSHVTGAFAGLFADDAAKCVVAYEPVWAIGTGKTASPEEAQEVHAAIRKLVTEMYGEKLAENLRILYGGSVKADNAAGLFAKEDIDGGLIGGASLKPKDFEGIVRAACP